MAPYTVPFLFTILVLMNSCSQVTTTGRLIDGKLKPCPDSPNCVSSETNSTPHIQPIAYTASDENAWEHIQACIVKLGGKIVKKDPSYISATFTSKIFRFVDDVELRMDKEQKIIHIRSGSRTGYSDFGVNKRRVEKIRALFSTD